MQNIYGKHRKGFSILESLLMLVLLVIFSFVTIGVFRKGISKSVEAEDPAWLSKGGDESMKTVNLIPAIDSAPPAQREQPGLGGGSLNAQESTTAESSSQQK